MISALCMLFEIGVNLYQGFLVSHFVYTVLGDKQGKTFAESGGVVCGIILTAVITVISYFFYYKGMYMFAYIVIVLIYSLLRLKGGFLKKLFTSSFPLVFIMIITVFVSNLSSLILDRPINDIFLNKSFERFVSVIFCQIIIMYIYKLALQIFRNKGNYSLKNTEWILILTVLFVSTFISFFLNFMGSQEISNIVGWSIVLSILGIIVINIITVYFVVIISEKNSAVSENQMLKMQQEYQNQYVETAENQYEKIKKMRHEFKNHNTVLASLLERDDIDKAKEYLNDYTGQITDFGVIVNTNNQVVNAVINCKAGLAESFNIKTSVVTVSEFTGIDDLDLCSLISNMFDNAIEACVNLANERKIIFSASKDGSNYIFCMKNTIDSSILKKNSNLVTTKSDKKIHGFGIKMLRDIAGKYNGFVDFFEKDDFFVCYILLQQS